MAKVSINLDGVRSKLSKGAVKRGQYALANQALADMNNYVPALDHHLRNSATIDVDGSAVSWNTPYARAQFYGNNGIVSFHNYTTPGTGKRWDLKAKGIHMKDWERAFAKGADW